MEADRPTASVGIGEVGDLVDDPHIQRCLLSSLTPRRLPTTRRGLPDSRLDEINHTATTTTGNDPVLDSLITRLHTETACRRGGALALTPRDLDPDNCLIMLHEKWGVLRILDRASRLRGCVHA
ncbi:hypothetical protein [Saccharopolyspora sp. NPDC002376]